MKLWTQDEVWWGLLWAPEPTRRRHRPAIRRRPRISRVPLHALLAQQCSGSSTNGDHRLVTHAIPTRCVSCAAVIHPFDGRSSTLEVEDPKTRPAELASTNELNGQYQKGRRGGGIYQSPSTAPQNPTNLTDGPGPTNSKPQPAFEHTAARSTTNHSNPSTAPSSPPTKSVA